MCFLLWCCLHCITDLLHVVTVSYIFRIIFSQVILLDTNCFSHAFNLCCLSPTIPSTCEVTDVRNVSVVEIKLSKAWELAKLGEQLKRILWLMFICYNYSYCISIWQLAICNSLILCFMAILTVMLGLVINQLITTGGANPWDAINVGWNQQTCLSLWIFDFWNPDTFWYVHFASFSILFHHQVYSNWGIEHVSKSNLCGCLCPHFGGFLRCVRWGYPKMIGLFENPI